jgi:CRISPR-associated protein Cas6
MNPFIDLRFPLRGSTIRADHAYLLYGAVSTQCPDLHGEENERKSGLKDAFAPAILGIHTVAGQLIGARRLRLKRSSALTLRLPSDKIGAYLVLAGKTLRIGNDSVTTGVPQIEVLKPVSFLQARLICIKGATTPQLMLEKATKHILSMGLTSPEIQIGIPLPKSADSHDGRQGSRVIRDTTGRDGSKGIDQSVRRTLRINGKEIIGFPIEVSGLSAEDSIRLQEQGLGGRRHFGCGIFTRIHPTKL